MHVFCTAELRLLALPSKTQDETPDARRPLPPGMYTAPSPPRLPPPLSTHSHPSAHPHLVSLAPPHPSHLCPPLHPFPCLPLPHAPPHSHSPPPPPDVVLWWPGQRSEVRLTGVVDLYRSRARCRLSHCGVWGTQVSHPLPPHSQPLHKYVKWFEFFTVIIYQSVNITALCVIGIIMVVQCTFM